MSEHEQFLISVVRTTDRYTVPYDLRVLLVFEMGHFGSIPGGNGGVSIPFKSRGHKLEFPTPPAYDSALVALVERTYDSKDLRSELLDLRAQAVGLEASVSAALRRLS